MKAFTAIVLVTGALISAGCATRHAVETVNFDTSVIRPALPESKLPPAAPGVYDLSKVDSPPAPLKNDTVDALARAYDRRVTPLGTGAATVVYTISEKGRVSDVSVYSATDAGYAAAVTSIVKSWKFVPARKDGHPVACRSSWGTALTLGKTQTPAVAVRPDYRGLGPVSRYDRGDGF